MATRFKRGEAVKLRTSIPEGPIQSFRMDEDGVVWCLLEWLDIDGKQQSRWFREDELVAA